MRLASIVVLILTLTSCGPLRTLPPLHLTEAHRIRVFTDGFHSGLIVERRTLPTRLNPPMQGLAEQAQLKSLHFGEEAWTAGWNMSDLHAFRLAFIPGTGVIQSDPTESDAAGIPGLERNRIKTWDFHLSQTAMNALMNRLETHWLAEPLVTVDEPDLPPTILFESRQPWSGFDNCHDFTVDLLRAAGLNLRPQTLRLARNLTQDLDRATVQLREAGITVVGPAETP